MEFKKYGEDKPIIICMHYPPYTNYNVQNLLDSPFIEIMRKYNVKKMYIWTPTW